MNKKSFNMLFTAVALVFLSFLGAVVVKESSAQWVGITASPPQNNLPPPLNIGTLNQRKEGGLTLGSNLWLEQGARFFPVGGTQYWQVSNLADTLTFQARTQTGLENRLTIQNNGDVLSTGTICDSSGCIGGAALESDPTVQANVKDGVDWAELTGIPIGFADNTDDGGIAVESDPTVQANVKDGVDWAELTGIPAGFLDGVDDSGASYIAGSGISIAGNTISADTAAVQARVSGTCVTGSSVRVINQDGTVVCEIDDVGGAAAGGWKLLASGSDWSEEARVTLQNTGITWETEIGDVGQTIEGKIFDWPLGAVSEIMFEAENEGDNFCMGGGALLNLASGGSGVWSRCQNVTFSGTNVTRNNVADEDNIALVINGTPMVSCPDDTGRSSNNSSYPGKLINQYKTGYCTYTEGIDWSGGIINRLDIEEIDWSPSFGYYDWKIWYK